MYVQSHRGTRRKESSQKRATEWTWLDHILPNLFFNALCVLLLFLNLCFFILSLLFLNTESMYKVLSSASFSKASEMRGDTGVLPHTCCWGNRRDWIFAKVCVMRNSAG